MGTKCARTENTPTGEPSSIAPNQTPGAILVFTSASEWASSALECKSHWILTNFDMFAGVSTHLEAPSSEPPSRLQELLHRTSSLLFSARLSPFTVLLLPSCCPVSQRAGTWTRRKPKMMYTGTDSRKLREVGINSLVLESWWVSLTSPVVFVSESLVQVLLLSTANRKDPSWKCLSLKSSVLL